MKYNIIPLILTICFLLIAGSVAAQWSTEKSPVMNNLNSIALYDNAGWIVGNGGTIIYKNNEKWIKYPELTDADLYSICLVGKDIGWAVGSKGTILHLKGNSWVRVECPTREDLYSVSFRDASHGIAVGARGTILVYENGIWRLTKTNLIANLYTVSDNKSISLTGGGREFYNMPLMRIDRGAEDVLTKMYDPGYTIIKSLAITENNTIWSVGISGTIYNYNQNGWKKIKQPAYNLPTLNSVFFASEHKGITAGFGGTILTFSEKGWQKEESIVSVKLNGVAISGNKYYAVGNNGTILSLYKSSEIPPVKTSSSTPDIKVDSYPNPTGSYLNIIVPYEPGFGNGTLTIVNSLGQTVMIKNLNNVAGESYRIDTSNFGAGIYIINIHSIYGPKAAGKFIIRH